MSAFLDYCTTFFGIAGAFAFLLAGLALLADYLEGEERSIRERYENFGREL